MSCLLYLKFIKKNRNISNLLDNKVGEIKPRFNHGLVFARDQMSVDAVREGAHAVAAAAGVHSGGGRGVCGGGGTAYRSTQLPTAPPATRKNRFSSLTHHAKWTFVVLNVKAVFICKETL